MATIGVEYLDSFSHVRAANVINGGEDLSAPYYIATWFAGVLADAGHPNPIFHANLGCGERQMRAASLGGQDTTFADSVDLWLICTHGDYKNGELLLLYDNQLDDWFAESKKWHFGDACNLEWLMIFGCQSIDGDHVQQHLGLFKGLHEVCGAYSYMYDSWTIDEAGNDTANNLLDGDAVSDAWLDGVSDWWVENHPMVLSVELEDTWNGGHPHWSQTVIKSDHLWGTGTTTPDIQPNKQFWMATVQCDGGIYDGWP
jgi:hypothetical protein